MTPLAGDPEVDWTRAPGHCYECGEPLPDDWDQGRCPRCLGYAACPDDGYPLTIVATDRDDFFIDSAGDHPRELGYECPRCERLLWESEL